MPLFLNSVQLSYSSFNKNIKIDALNGVSIFSVFIGHDIMSVFFKV